MRPYYYAMLDNCDMIKIDTTCAVFAREYCDSEIIDPIEIWCYYDGEFHFIDRRNDDKWEGGTNEELTKEMKEYWESIE